MVSKEAFLRAIRTFVVNDAMTVIGQDNSSINMRIIMRGIPVIIDKRPDVVFSMIRSNDIIKSFGVIDANDNVDVDFLGDVLPQMLGEDKVTICFKIPFEKKEREIALSAQDIRKIISYI